MNTTISHELQQEIIVSQLQLYLNTQLEPEEKIQARYLLSIIDYNKFGNLTISEFKEAMSKK